MGDSADQKEPRAAGLTIVWRAIEYGDLFSDVPSRFEVAILSPKPMRFIETFHRTIGTRVEEVIVAKTIARWNEYTLNSIITGDSEDKTFSIDDVTCFTSVSDEEFDGIVTGKYKIGQTIYVSELGIKRLHRVRKDGGFEVALVDDKTIQSILNWRALPTTSLHQFNSLANEKHTVGDNATAWIRMLLSTDDVTLEIDGEPI